MNSSFREKVLACSWISEEEFQDLYVECGAERGAEWINMDVSNKFREKYLHLHRDCGADIYELIQKSENGLKLQNNIGFAKDSLFCEWGYVVDLDKNTFEVYSGFNKKPLTEGERFAFLNEKCEEEYYPIKLVKSYSLNELPTEEQFIKDCDPPEEEEDEEEDPNQGFSAPSPKYRL